MLINQDIKCIKTVVLDDCKNSLEEFVAIVRHHAKVEFSEEYCRRVTKSRRILEDRLSDGVAIYGVNTGFGDNVRYRIEQDDMVKLQENIIRSHGCSVGRPMGEEEVRAMLLLLLTNMGKGYSAIRLQVLELVRDFLNHSIYPYVPSEGSVGCLSTQPYMSMTLMGEGRIIHEGVVKPAAQVLAHYGLSPIQLAAREGLGLLTNASGSQGLAMLAIYDYIITIRHADICAGLVCQALGSSDTAFDARLMELKGHKEQIDTATYLRALLKDSPIIEKARASTVQDASAIRIIPHVHGTSKRLGHQAYESIMEEFNAVFDNPVFLDDGTALMGSNWDATLIQTYCDALMIGVMNMAKLLEVHMERMVTPTLSGLPAFLVKNPGLNNGFMLVQYTTAGLLADIIQMATPAGHFHGAVSAGQESPLYRDDAAAKKLYTAVEKLQHLTSLTLMTAAQALDFHTLGMSPATATIHSEIRKTVDFMENDDLMYIRIEAMERVVRSGVLLTHTPIPFTH